MSLIPQQLAPVLARFDPNSLPNTTTLIVIRGNLNVSTRGHTFGNFTSSSTKSAGIHLGDHIEMSSMAQRTNRLHSSLPISQDFETPPPSEAEKIDDIDHHTQVAVEDEEAPLEYRDRDFNWFVPGRLFKIFAPQDVEIHKKEFVLLDTKNKEGPGLLICAHHEDEGETNKGYFLRSHVAVQNFISPEDRGTSSRTKTVYLDAYEDREVEFGTWIELEHSYNIPFAKYKCVDRGVLDRASLQDLRRSYVGWLQYHWSLG